MWRPNIALVSTFLLIRGSLALSQQAVTVRDLVELPQLVRASAQEEVVAYAPDGRSAAIVVKKGNIARNVVDYSLVVFDLASARVRVDTLLRRATSADRRDAITQVRWLSDNRTLAFLAEDPGTLPQVYTLDVHSHKLTRRTGATTEIKKFEVGASGDPVLFAAQRVIDTSAYSAMRANGFVVAPQALMSDLISGVWLNESIFDARRPQWLTWSKNGRTHRVELPGRAEGYSSCDAAGASLAPTGDRLLLTCQFIDLPPMWNEYTEPRYLNQRQGFQPSVFVVLETANGHSKPLTWAPVPWLESAIWAPDGKSVMIASALLPLDVADSTERAARAAHKFVAEVNVQTGEVSIALMRDTLRALSWDSRTGIVELASDRYASELARSRHVFLRKSGRVWEEIPSPANEKRHLLIEESMNEPPRVVVLDGTTRTFVYDVNPGLERRFRLARETMLRWRTKNGGADFGGIFWPVGYTQGKRYPVVLQTHGFDSTSFSPSGLEPGRGSGYAAQVLASAGYFVVQMRNVPSEVSGTEREGPWAQASMEGLIDHLDSLELIDRTKVAIQGWSRTCFWAMYLLTHSSYPIAAVSIYDGYTFNYMGAFTSTEGLYVQVDKVNAAPPWGDGLEEWLKRAPGFRLDRVKTPVQLSLIKNSSLPMEWELYKSLERQGKPVELIYYPEGFHALHRPLEQIAARQRTVDWFRFWIEGYEDADARKAEQYARWGAMRARSKETATR
jgi:dipeptidyl aminopeptidase/acylaminoacyl peptidase